MELSVGQSRTGQLVMDFVAMNVDASLVADPGFLEGGFCYTVARGARAKFWKPRPFLSESRPFRSF